MILSRYAHRAFSFVILIQALMTIHPACASYKKKPTVRHHAQATTTNKKAKTDLDFQYALQLNHDLNGNKAHTTQKSPVHPTQRHSKQANKNTHADHLFAVQLNQDLNGTKVKQNTHTASTNVATKISSNAEYMRATQQQGPSCGHHSLINAWAIQELLQQHNPVTSQSVAQKAAQKYHLIPKKPQMLELQDIITRYNNDILDVKSLYFLVYTGNGYVQSAGQSEREKLSLSKRVAQFKQQSNDHMFFICHIPGHWIITAAIKTNDTLRIILLDSMNASLDASRLAHVEYVQDLLA